MLIYQIHNFTIKGNTSLKIIFIHCMKSIYKKELKLLKYFTNLDSISYIFQHLIIQYPDIISMDSKYFKGTTRSVIAFASRPYPECTGVDNPPTVETPLDSNDVTFVHVIFGSESDDHPRLFASFGLDFTPNHIEILPLEDQQVVVASSEKQFQAYIVDEHSPPRQIASASFTRTITTVRFFLYIYSF